MAHQLTENGFSLKFLWLSSNLVCQHSSWLCFAQIFNYFNKNGTVEWNVTNFLQFKWKWPLKRRIQNLSFSDRKRILNSNELIAHYVQYREEILFKEIIADGPLGRVKYYAIWIFQVNWGLHVYMSIWVIDAPILTVSNKQACINFTDWFMKCNLLIYKKIHKSSFLSKYVKFLHSLNHVESTKI